MALARRPWPTPLLGCAEARRQRPAYGFADAFLVNEERSCGPKSRHTCRRPINFHLAKAVDVPDAVFCSRHLHDPIFPINFPWFGSSDYWQGQVQMLEEQLEAMAEEPLVV